MPFKKGQSGNKSGRPKGAPNKLTKTVKETVLNVFNELQLDEEVNLRAFAIKYPRDFYVIAAKLIPTEINGQVDVTTIKQLIFEPASKKDTSK